MSKIKFAYFGGEPIGVPVLEELKKTGLLPELVIASPDKPVGRKQVVTPPPVKVWAEANGVEVFQPEQISKEKGSLGRLTAEDWDLFVVVAYNRILPKWLIDLPKHQTINLHPSLLPKLRGASPIRSTLLQNMKDDCGVSVMLLDEQMDHGSILAQQKMLIAEEFWPLSGPELDKALANLGGAVLADTIPNWVNERIEPQEQQHEEATYCGKITKDMAELKLDPHHLPTGKDAYEIFLKIQAYAGWPTAFFIHNNKRYKITSAHLSEAGDLVIESVIPEGKKEQSFEQIFSK